MKAKKSILKLRIFQQIASDFIVEKGHFIREVIIPAVMEGEKIVTPAKKIPAHYAKDQTKLSLNIKSMLTRQIPDIIKKYNEDCQDCRDMNAAVHPTYNTILTNEKTKENEYTAAGKIKMRKELLALLNEEVLIDQRISEGWEKEGLTEDQIKVFSGIVIPEQPIEDEEEKPKKAKK